MYELIIIISENQMEPETIAKFKECRWVIFECSLDQLIETQKELCLSNQNYTTKEIKAEIDFRIRQLQKQDEMQKTLTKINQAQLNFTQITKKIKQKISLGLLKSRKEDMLLSIYQKYGSTRQIETYTRYKKKKLSKSEKEQQEEMAKQKYQGKPRSKFISFIREKIPILKSALAETEQEGSEATESKKSSKFTSEQEESSPDTNLRLITKQKCEANYWAHIAKLKACRWAICKYSRYELIRIQQELSLTDQKQLVPIKIQVAVRINQMRWQKKKQKCILLLLLLEKNSVRTYRNLFQYNRDLKQLFMQQQTRAQYPKKVQQKVWTQIKEQETNLARIILKGQKLKPVNLSEEELALLKKDEREILCHFNACPWKVYFCSLECLVRIQKQISKLKQEQVLEMQIFLAHRIAFLKVKQECFEIIAQILPLTTKNLQCMKKELQIYYEMISRY